MNKSAKLSKLGPINNKIPEINKLLDNLPKLEGMKDEKINFSFLFFNKEHKLFNLGGADIGWFVSLLNELAAVSKLNWTDVFHKHKSKYDPHPYNEKANIDVEYNMAKVLGVNKSLIEDQLELCQLRIQSSSGGRMHGFRLANIYYVVWLDPKHNMYDTTGYESATSYTAPKTEYELLAEKHKKLQANVEVFEAIFNDTCGENCPYLKK